MGRNESNNHGGRSIIDITEINLGNFFIFYLIFFFTCSVLQKPFTLSGAPSCGMEAVKQFIEASLIEKDCGDIITYHLICYVFFSPSSFVCLFP